MKTVISLVLLLLSSSTCISQAEEKSLLRGDRRASQKTATPERPQPQNERHLKMPMGKASMNKYMITGAPASTAPIEKAIEFNARQITNSPSTKSPRQSESPSVGTSGSPSVSPSASTSESQSESPTSSPVARGNVCQGQPIPSLLSPPPIPIRVVEGPGFIYYGPLVGVFPSAAPTSKAPSVSATPSDSGSLGATTTSANSSERATVRSSLPGGGVDEPKRVTEGPNWIYWGPLVGVETASPAAPTLAPAIIRTEGPDFLRTTPPV